MTDKQIIIDGVDVSGCEYCGYDNVCRLSDYIVDCKDNPNCHYKQLEKLKAENLGFKILHESDKDLLKRKEQECEELKKQRQADKGLITSTGKMNYQLLQEYDKLKTALTEIKEFFNEECIICKENYINITGEICEECKYKEILQKISECEGNDE